jgi:hypothetical protein
VDAPEDLVDFPVSATAPSPAFDDAGVVPMDFEFRIRVRRCEDHPDEELKTNGLCPGNVSATFLPSWE